MQERTAKHPEKEATLPELARIFFSPFVALKQQFLRDIKDGRRSHRSH